MAYIIETRTPETEGRRAGEWHSDGIRGGPWLVETEEEAKERIVVLLTVGPAWAEAEYRYREASLREFVAMVRAKGGICAELAGHMDALLDEAAARGRGEG